jgi:ABC-type transport system substrate-binding protein
LRQALSLCYDVPLHIDVLFNGRGIPAKNCIPSSFPGWEEAGPSPYATLNIEKAKAKLEEAREELIAKGIIRPGEPIPPLTIDIGDRGEYGRRLGQFMTSQFRRIGVELKVELQDWPTLQEKVHNKRSQMYTMGWAADYPDAENFLQLFYGPNIEHGTNNSNYRNPRFDALFEKAAVTMDLEDRIPLYVEMIHIVSEDCPVLLLSEPISYLLRYRWMKNIQPHPIRRGTGVYWKIDTNLRHQMGGPE